MSSDLKSKLYQYEEVPPSRNWDAIVDALNSNTGVEKKLYNYEEIPHFQNWQKIVTALDKNATVQRVSSTSKIRKIISYAAAAAVIILVGYTGTLLFNKTKEEPPIVKVNIPKPVNKFIPPTTVQQDEVVEVSEPKQKIIAKRIISSETDNSETNYLSCFDPTNVALNYATVQSYIPDYDQKIQQLDLDHTERYMVYTDEHGNGIKVPKKLFNVVHCVGGDQSCKEHIEKLQQKVVTASLSNDFMGFVQMLKEVQENQ